MILDPGKLALWILFGILPILGFLLGLRAPAVRRQGPIILAFFAGIIPILSLYIPKVFLDDPEIGMSPRLDQYLIIVAGFALPLGIVNVIQNNSRRVGRRDKGWFYAVVLLIGLFVTGALGDLRRGDGRGDRLPARTVPRRRSSGSRTTRSVRSRRPSSRSSRSSWRAPHSERSARETPRPRSCSSPGLLVMLGRVPLLEFLATPFPALMPAAAEGSLRLGQLTEWIMNVPNSAAQAGIIIGAALGAAAMAIRVILGIERSYLGLEKGE